MTVKELSAWLAKQPQDAEVWYRDMNFGGRDRPVEFSTFEGICFEHGDVLVASVHFEYVD